MLRDVDAGRCGIMMLNFSSAFEVSIDGHADVFTHANAPVRSCVFCYAKKMTNLMKFYLYRNFQNVHSSKAAFQEKMKENREGQTQYSC